MIQQKTQRQEAILSSFLKLDYLTREHIQKLHNIPGDRNARRILASLNPYLSAFRGSKGEYIYFLNKAGREATGAEKVRTKLSQAGHYLMRADAFIYFSPADWKNEMRFEIKEAKLTVISDAYFWVKGKRYFLEVDHLQHMAKNKEKIERYRKLKDTGALQKRLGYFPGIVWVTLTENRRKQLTEWCEGLETKIHLWDEIR